MVKPSTNWLMQVADTKYVGYGEKAAFKVKQEGIRAFIQAKGATPARSKIAHKQVTLDTIAVSARPVINTYELKTGRVQMADLIRDAANEMSQKEIEHIQTVLHTAAANWSTPFYGTGGGVVKAVLNPMIQHWMRTGAVSLLGDIAIISKLAEQTGFTASTKKGAKGDDVRWLQWMLEACGYSVGKCGIDGDFGSATRAAVRLFQREHSLSVDAIAGPLTRAALKETYQNK